MQTPVANTGPHSVESTSSHDRLRQSSDTEQPGQAGWALISVFLVSIALWAGIIFGVKALIAAL